MKANVRTERLVPVELAGTTYFMNCSFNALKKFAKELKNIPEDSDSGYSPEALGSIVEVIACMIQQGAAYKKLVEGDDVPSLTADELGVIAGASDADMLVSKMKEAIAAGTSRTIEVKPDPKNKKAAQG